MKSGRDPDAVRREDRLDAAIARADEGLMKLLVDSVDDADPGVRGTAAYGLGEVSDRRAIPILVGLVDNDMDETVVLHALKSMESYRDPIIHECLLREAQRARRSRSPRWYVAKQLRWYDSAQSVESLLVLLTDQDVLVRQTAEESLIALRPGDRDHWQRLAAEQDY